jgi:hypothetical protein
VRLALLALAACISLGASAPPALLLRAQAWTAPGPSMAHDLTHAPRECLAASSPEIEIGRALFRAPAMLGGPAARAGLSCHACHGNGRVNARFLLPELTDRPGAADVTSAWASKLRGDGVLNPVAIPDLAGIARRQTFGQARDASLEHFVQSVIVEEFQGEPPPAQAFASVIAYMRALDECALEEAPITLAAAAGDVRRALAAARGAAPETAALLVLSARDGIGRIVERLPPASFAPERRVFETLARELGQGAASPAWSARFDAALARVAARERRTYFNERTLAAALRG